MSCVSGLHTLILSVWFPHQSLGFAKFCEIAHVMVLERGVGHVS